ncbi:hypothetical protein B4U79_02466 [Dinothrombium tinctorium]|uniref:ADAM 17-like protease n=1 Tax=Dinothrombium tinctorium TaxID=1965070 RepID=A0A3S3P936_9ACAR|nr:hypothetical protein B4U79_10818 [Dinothrombium tinctorium]RWS06396.1 hypothetical protein B4U79_05634 [Dinothrombium tinctorium]RWS07880.1 hypothetical protein B4U79_02466 [Dinothrombium tinctorium]
MPLSNVTTAIETKRARKTLSFQNYVNVIHFAFVEFSVDLKHCFTKLTSLLLLFAVIICNVSSTQASILDFKTIAFRKSAKPQQLTKYELLTVDNVKHRIINKREAVLVDGANYGKQRELTFSAFNQQFRLILNRNQQSLANHFKAYEVDGWGAKRPVNVNRDEFFDGHIMGKTRSNVSAHLDEETGLLTAAIYDDDDGEVYFVEPLWRHVTGLNSNNSMFYNQTMLIYKASDIEHSWTLYDKVNNGSFKRPFSSFCDYIKIPDNVTVSTERSSFRKRRDVPKSDDYLWYPDENEGGENNDENTRCSLLLVADYLFFREMGGSNLKQTINFLIALIDRVNKIYLKTSFGDSENDPEAITGMGFLIQEILVHTEPTRLYYYQRHYNMEREKWSVRELLEEFSRDITHDSFCLAHLFTHRKFSNAVLGLAYVASPKKSSVGGICSPVYHKSNYTLYLNSGLTTTKNAFGARVITREVDLVTAHELGHNWGAEHDPDLFECSPPSSYGGAYIMYTFSVSGYDLNNKKFSPCSRRSIKAVLRAKAAECFIKPRASFCGNSVVEEGEECDAGLIGIEEFDPCCNSACRLKAGAVCSDKNSPCCNNCGYILSPNVTCRDRNPFDCKSEAYCSRTSAICPKADPLSDGTICLDKGVCRGGRCVPFCEIRGLHSCMCDSKANECKRCCRSSLIFNATCEPYSETEVLPNGTPCKFGYCLDGRCKRVEGQGIIRRFWGIIEEGNVNAFARFMKDNIVGVIIVVSLLLWIPSTYFIDKYDEQLKTEIARRKEARKCRRSSCLGGTPYDAEAQVQRKRSNDDSTNDNCSQSDEDGGFNDPYYARRRRANNSHQRPYHTSNRPVDPRFGTGFRPQVIYRSTDETVCVEIPKNANSDDVDEQQVRQVRRPLTTDL